jgi:hypothetical protein
MRRDEMMREEHRRPAGVSDADVEAAGRMTEALERLERARGHLYAFHQLLGETDLLLDEVLDALARGGRDEIIKSLQSELVGRNVLEGRWTFQIVEEFDDTYYSCFREHERRVRDALTAGRRHVAEAEMKQRRRTHGLDHHEAEP